MSGEGYRKVALSQAMEMLPGFAFRSDNFTTDSTDGLPLIRIRDLGNQTTACRYRGEYGETFVVSDGDVLVGMDGEFVAVRWEGGPALLNQRVLKLSSAMPDILDDNFLFYRLQPTLAELEQSISGTTVKHLSTKDLKRLAWDVPPLNEQRRIAEVLRSVEEAIATTDQALIAARGLKQTLTEAFLSESQDAPLVRLHEVVSETGSGWSPNCEADRAGFDEWAVLKTSAITWDGYCDDENKRLPSDLEPRPHLAVRANDILITRAGQAYRTGVVAMVHDTCGMRMISDKMIRIRADQDKIAPVILCEILKSRSVQGQLNPLKSGLTTLTNVTQKMVANLTFHLPPMEMQQDFALSIDAVAADIQLLQDEANALARLMPALQADLLSGRVRVPA